MESIIKELGDQSVEQDLISEGKRVSVDQTTCLLVYEFLRNF